MQTIRRSRANPAEGEGAAATQGAGEDWTIENRALENHEFHIHQIHFLVLERNGVPVPNGQSLDTVQVPYWSGSGPYPSVKKYVWISEATPSEMSFITAIFWATKMAA